MDAFVIVGLAVGVALIMVSAWLGGEMESRHTRGRA